MCDKGDAVLGEACKREAASALDQQHLFSVYIHTPPDVTGALPTGGTSWAAGNQCSRLPRCPPSGFAPGSLWDGHLIPHRIPTGWGNISLVEATRSLMREAFRDPLNQRWGTRLGRGAFVPLPRLLLARAVRLNGTDRTASSCAPRRFVLLSESDIPLYDPLTLYQQLLAEERSRVNACNHTSRHEWRWGDSMQVRATCGLSKRCRVALSRGCCLQRAQTENMNRSHFRKSGQFIGLTRAHAAAVLADSEVFQAFARHCTLEWDERRNSIRDCIPGEPSSARCCQRASELPPQLRCCCCVADEHYFPTLLAVLGLEHETECDGWGVATQDWSKGGAHPKAYRYEALWHVPPSGICARGLASRHCMAALHFQAQRSHAGAGAPCA